MNWRIRTATTHDIPALVGLRWDFSPDEVAAGMQSFDAFTLAFTAFLETALASDEWSVWVAESSDVVVANAYVRISPKLPRPGRFGERHGYVTNVYVASAQRSQGIGAALMQRIVAWAHEAQLTSLMLWPTDERVGFYEQLGFTLCVMGQEL